MKRNSLVAGLLGMCLVFSLAQSVLAQYPGAGWPRPGVSRRAFSPWFGLQRDGGVLSNYHTYVQPEIQLRNTLRRHDRQKSSVEWDYCKCIANNELRPVLGLAQRHRSIHSTHCYERSSVSNAIRERPATKSAV